MSTLQRTPLFPKYAEHPSVRCIDFGGWELPVQFSGIQREHEAVRQQAGLFDVSHMGELFVSGSAAFSFLQKMTTNDLSKLEDGKAQYSLLCYPHGGVVDDLLVYRLAEDRYMLVVNASNTDKVVQWVQDHAEKGVHIDNASSRTALLALQGPQALSIMTQATEAAVGNLKSFHFLSDVQVCGVRALVSRTGYTGEDGFELYIAADDAPHLWSELLRIGEPFGLVPAGLGARDTLRFEAKLPLYGQELSEQITPLEAGLGWCVKLNKGEFIGREAIAKQKEEGVPRRLAGIEMIDRGIPRTHYPVYAGDKLIGEVTSGTQSPTLKRNLGLALIESPYAELDTELEVEIRGKRLKARVVAAPFYQRPTTTKGGSPT
ncbi:glycine cleavage system aminomethyltransferase GcvT [Paenibacillus melissococcoides]|uniref:Aminomethyltransferase n=1 Tax=Paenibacillus melissococcoides TaxID=2912268 RepID=A0ABM9FYB4_9BACL|nr:glycine cleavage system aminomethyltransferase GcvT [Paenibacillus melissococcoides]CAH8243981.1 glycine cleavage system aminomethyltransferase GcvT [Paenibacillus melissococcoides]CAH8704095.1 glycine cleavage system aminomethyltransferase GcvT [Paenibacillus melissococcoides]CAH8706802.1 glycine cleavage system aminomethyltransferase GcvT [Paenibacillus melissococcoides]